MTSERSIWLTGGMAAGERAPPPCRHELEELHVSRTRPPIPGWRAKRHRVLGQSVAGAPQSVKAVVWMVVGVKKGLVPSVHGDIETIRLAGKDEAGTCRGKRKHAGAGASNGTVWRSAGRRCGYVLVVRNGGFHRGHVRDGYGDRSSETMCQSDGVWQVIDDKAVSSRSDERGQCQDGVFTPWSRGSGNGSGHDNVRHGGRWGA